MKPKTNSAAGVARAISRICKAHGFLMSDKSDPFDKTEGVCVSRVLYSNRVKVYYHVPMFGNNHPPSYKESKMKEVRTFLKDRGYVLNERDQITCESM